jgi:hypothetical protein
MKAKAAGWPRFRHKAGGGYFPCDQAHVLYVFLFSCVLPNKPPENDIFKTANSAVSAYQEAMK